MQDSPVLIVDGNSFFQKMLKSIFQKLGLPTISATDLETAVDYLSREATSFILLDSTLPGVAAGQTVPYLQSLSKKIPAVILMVQEHDPNPGGTQASAQANGYLVKPFTESEVRSWLVHNATVLLGHEWAPPVLGLEAASEREMEADPGQVEEWLADMHSEDVTASIHAIESLAKHQIRSSVQSLIDFTYEATGQSKVAAIRALGQLGDRTATEALVANLNHSDQALKETSLEALGELGDPRALRPLSRILKVNDRNLVLLAIKALGMLKVAEAKEILSPLLSSPDPKIKAHVQWAIRSIDGMDA